MHSYTLRLHSLCYAIFGYEISSCSIGRVAFNFMERGCHFFLQYHQYSKLGQHILSGSIFMKCENSNEQVYFNEHKM